MEIIEKESWDWILKKDGSIYTLSIVMGGAAIYEKEIELSEQQVLIYLEQGREYLVTLVAKYRTKV